MATATDESALRERAFASLCDIDLCGVAAVSDAAGTPLHDSAALLMPGARSIVVLGVELFPEVLRLVEPDTLMGEAAARELYTPHVDFMNSRLNRALYTKAPLPSTRREVADPCADCAGDCISRCPAGALAEPADGQRYGVNKYACASFRAGAGACSTCMSECLRA
jgi:epoxyqueuosine reductase QueG